MTFRNTPILIRNILMFKMFPLYLEFWYPRFVINCIREMINIKSNTPWYSYFSDASCLTLKSYVCKECGKAYKNQRNLNCHKHVHCGIVPSHKCPHCSYKCTQKYRLKVHIKSKHSWTWNFLYCSSFSE